MAATLPTIMHVWHVPSLSEPSLSPRFGRIQASHLMKAGADIRDLRKERRPAGNV